MLVPARIYASETLLGQMDAGVFEQVTNVACLPGIVRAALCMPDGHWGYGFPIGGVAAFAPTRASSRRAASASTSTAACASCAPSSPRIRCGRGSRSSSKRSSGRFPAGSAHVASCASRHGVPDVMREGAGWCVRHGYGWPEDLERTEGRGCLPGATPSTSASALSSAASSSSARSAPATTTSRSRWCAPTGSTTRRSPARSASTDRTDLRHAALRLARLRPPGGDRLPPAVRLGHAALRHHRARPRARLRALPFPRGAGLLRRDERRREHGLREPAGDHAPRARGDGRSVRQGSAELGLSVVYDVCHNTAKLERHRVDGEALDLVVHRKGATRAFGPGMPDVPAVYREVGQPVIIGGSMETGSALLVGHGARDGGDVRLDGARRRADDVAPPGEAPCGRRQASGRHGERAASWCARRRSPASPRRRASPTRT